MPKMSRFYVAVLIPTARTTVKCNRYFTKLYIIIAPYALYMLKALMKDILQV